MFRFAELLILVIFLYLIANLLRYILVKLGNLGRNSVGWMFGLSEGWLKNSDKKKGGK